MDEYGKIICAALLYDNCIYMSELGHYAIFPMEPIGVLRNAQQGFVTENGYFVDRIVGLRIAEYYGQIEKKYPPKDQLVSEDLKKEKYKILQYQDSYIYKVKKE